MVTMPRHATLAMPLSPSASRSSNTSTLLCNHATMYALYAEMLAVSLTDDLHCCFSRKDWKRIDLSTVSSCMRANGDAPPRPSCSPSPMAVSRYVPLVSDRHARYIHGCCDVDQLLRSRQARRERCAVAIVVGVGGAIVAVGHVSCHEQRGRSLAQVEHCQGPFIPSILSFLSDLMLAR